MALKTLAEKAAMLSGSMSETLKRFGMAKELKQFADEGQDTPGHYIDELAKLFAAEGWSTKQFVEWMTSPLPIENMSPFELVLCGDGQRLVSRLIALAQGNVST